MYIAWKKYVQIDGEANNIKTKEKKISVAVIFIFLFAFTRYFN